MNKLLISVHDYQNAIDIIDLKNIYGIIVGYTSFSDNIDAKLSIKQIKNIVIKALENNIKVYVLIDTFIFENELNELKQLINDLNCIKVNGIVFNDFAINEICYENKYNLELIYHPKTLITNYGQFEFYLKNNISSVILPNELMLNEYIQMGNNKQGIKLIKQVSGYTNIMISRWQLIKNFCEKENISINELDDKKLFIKENTRDQESIIIENKYGTHIYSAFCISCISNIKELINNGIDYLYIDGYLHSSEWILNTTKLYSELINSLDDDKFNVEYFIKQEEKINLPDKTSKSFLGAKKDLLYLPKEMQENE